VRAFDFVAPATKAETLAVIADGDEETQLLAGGTGLLNLVKRRLAHPEKLVSLHRIRECSDIGLEDSVIEVGALCRLADLERDAGIGGNIPILAEVLHEIASPRIRDMATAGGAIAHGDPAQDLPVALLALDGTVTAESSEGSRRMPVAEFLRDYYETALSPNEMVTGITVPVPDAASRFAYRKFLPASKEDYACVSVLVRVDGVDEGIADCRIVIGSAGPTVFRVSRAEDIIRDAGRLSAEAMGDAAAAAMQDCDPVDDTRGSAAYKRRMAGVWVRRCLEHAGGRR